LLQTRQKAKAVDFLLFGFGVLLKQRVGFGDEESIPQEFGIQLRSFLFGGISAFLTL
jgi:hypothetical protein